MIYVTETTYHLSEIMALPSNIQLIPRHYEVVF